MSRELSFSTRLTSLLATMLLLGCGLVVGLNYLKFERILLDQQARVLEIIAEELGRTVENSLALGVQLAGVPGAQSLLERSREAEKLIAGLTISDTGNVVLFDTDRQNIGRALRQDQLAARGPLTGPWRFHNSDGYGIGAPIVNGYGVLEGAILLRYDRAAVDERLAATMLAMVQSFMLAVGMSVPFAALGLHLVTRQTRRSAAMEEAMQPGAPHLAMTAGLQAAIADADRLLTEAEAQLEQIASQLPDPSSPRQKAAAP